MELTKEKIQELKRVALRVRRHIVEMTTIAGSGHPGGSLSCTDVMTVLYFHRMRTRPDDPAWEDRDRFVLSKGHCAPVWYAILAERGYFPVEELKTLRKFGTRLQGHPSSRHTPGVDVASGSLGQGLSVANGMALAGKLDGKDYRVYAVIGDGEIDEGQIWEAAMAARHYQLDNLCVTLDNNGLQIDGKIVDVMNSNPIPEKWEAFGWNVLCIDGHNMVQINDAFEKAQNTKGKPSIIIAKTTKGKGVSFMENVVDFHGKAATLEECEQALAELAIED